jgi:hypothetical protein
LPIECEYQISSGFSSHLAKHLSKLDKQKDQIMNQFYKSVEEDYFVELKEELMGVVEAY